LTTKEQPDLKLIATKMNVAEWIKLERAEHAETKYGEGLPGRVALVDEMRTEGFGGGWEGFIGNYLKRVELFGLDTPQGRQALGKAAVTLIHMLETAVLVHGPMPKPGVPSGEIQEWLR
jgi:hypothetical protein